MSLCGVQARYLHYTCEHIASQIPQASSHRHDGKHHNNYYTAVDDQSGAKFAAATHYSDHLTLLLSGEGCAAQRAGSGPGSPPGGRQRLWCRGHSCCAGTAGKGQRSGKGSEAGCTAGRPAAGPPCAHHCPRPGAGQAVRTQTRSHTGGVFVNVADSPVLTG
jgi:hypothetical protein